MTYIYLYTTQIKSELDCCSAQSQNSYKNIQRAMCIVQESREDIFLVHQKKRGEDIVMI